MSNLNGRYAIVTGGCRGIGKAIVKRFVADGAAGVAIFEWNYEQAKKTAAEIDPSGEKVIAIACDVSKEDQVADAVKAAAEKFGTIDILVNNAGITKDSMFHKMTTEAWSAVINVNLYGVFHTCKYVVPIMREKGYGKIVNISSSAAWGNVGQANYAASKGAIISFARTLAKELGPKNITVNCIAPGPTKTDMFDTVPQKIIDEWLQGIPLRRLGEPEDIADVAAFLASDDSRWVTGQTIVTNGGARLPY